MTEILRGSCSRVKTCSMPFGQTRNGWERDWLMLLSRESQSPGDCDSPQGSCLEVLGPIKKPTHCRTRVTSECFTGSNDPARRRTGPGDPAAAEGFGREVALGRKPRREICWDFRARERNYTIDRWLINFSELKKSSGSWSLDSCLIYHLRET